MSKYKNKLKTRNIKTKETLVEKKLLLKMGFLLFLLRLRHKLKEVI